MKSAWCAAWCAVVVLSAASVVQAAPGAVLVGGAASKEDQELASAAVTSAASAEGWVISDKKYSTTTISAAEKCVIDAPKPWSCVSSLLQDRQVQLVAIVTLRPKPGRNGGTDTEISARLLLSNMDSLLVGQRTCEEQCTPDKLRSSMGRLTSHLLSRAKVRSGRTAISVTSTPTGAYVWIDAVQVGFTEFSTSIAPGTYSITVKLDGHESETRRVVIDEGTTKPVTFALKPLESKRPNPTTPDHGTGRNERPSRVKEPAKLSPLVPAGVAALGVAVLGTGIVQLWRDEDPVSGPGEPASPTYKDTGTQGFYMTLGGGAVLAGAAVIWWKFSRSSSAPLVAPVSGGAVVGFTGSF